MQLNDIGFASAHGIDKAWAQLAFHGKRQRPARKAQHSVGQGKDSHHRTVTKPNAHYTYTQWWQGLSLFFPVSPAVGIPTGVSKHTTGRSNQPQTPASPPSLVLLTDRIANKQCFSFHVQSHHPRAAHWSAALADFHPESYVY